MCNDFFVGFFGRIVKTFERRTRKGREKRELFFGMKKVDRWKVIQRERDSEGLKGSKNDNDRKDWRWNNHNNIII